MQKKTYLSVNEKLFIYSIHWRAPTKTPSLTVHTYEKRSVRVCTIRKVKSKREQKDYKQRCNRYTTTKYRIKVLLVVWLGEVKTKFCWLYIQTSCHHNTIADKKQFSLIFNKYIGSKWISCNFSLLITWISRLVFH